MIPSSESISTQRGANVRIVKDRQGGRHATRFTDRRWPVSRSAGSARSAGSPRSGRRLRGALGNGPRALDHVAATSSGISGCDSSCPTSDGLRPCHAPTNGRRGHLKCDSNDGNRASRYGRWLSNLNYRLSNRLDDLDHGLGDRLGYRLSHWLSNSLGARTGDPLGDGLSHRLDRLGDDLRLDPAAHRHLAWRTGAFFGLGRAGREQEGDEGRP